nr:MAG TPA: Cro protein [Caudoviricetes sp.]
MPNNNSSAEHFKISTIFFIKTSFNRCCPFSILQIAACEVPKDSASCSCVIPRLSRIVFKKFFMENIIFLSSFGVYIVFRIIYGLDNGDKLFDFRIMKLAAYLATNAIKQNTFALIIGAKQCVVSKYCAGQQIPRPDVMLKIFKATNGAVTPNDFYDICGDDANVPALIKEGTDYA